MVYADGAFASLAPPPLPVLPDWSPVAAYGGYYQPRSGPRPTARCGRPGHTILGALLGQLAPAPKSSPIDSGCRQIRYGKLRE